MGTEVAQFTWYLTHVKAIGAGGSAKHRWDRVADLTPKKHLHSITEAGTVWSLGVLR